MTVGKKRQAVVAESLLAGRNVAEIEAQIIVQSVAVQCVFDDQTLAKMAADIHQRLQPIFKEFIQDYGLEFIETVNTGVAVLVPASSLKGPTYTA